MSATYTYEVPTNGKAKSWCITIPEAELTSAGFDQYLKLGGCFNHLPGKVHRPKADLELPVWTAILRGEEVHHSKQRGWNFFVSIVAPGADADLKRWEIGTPGAAHKAWIKAHGGQHLMGGSGPHAAMLRCAVWVLEAPSEAERIQRIEDLIAC